MFKKERTIDQTYDALRPRLRNLARGTSTTTVVIPAHTHSAAQITLDPNTDIGGYLDSFNVQTGMEELDTEKLARSGVQAMLGDLDMGGFSIVDAVDGFFSGTLEVGEDIVMTGAGGGFALIDGVRRIVMVSDATIDFSAAGVGSAIINLPRVIHMAGDDDDGEARIDGLEAIVFNDEPTKSYIQLLSRIEWNVAAAGSVAVGVQSWDESSEMTLVTYVESGFGYAKIAYGWSVKEYLNGYGSEGSPSIPRFTLVMPDPSTGISDSNPIPVLPYMPLDNEQPELELTHTIPGVTMSDSDYGDNIVVMQRGIMRGVTEQNGEDWSNGDLLWGLSDGSISNVRPDAPDVQIYIGVIIGNNDGGDPFSVDVDVRIIPGIGELSGVSREEPVDRDVLVYRADDQVWEPRQLWRSTQPSADFDVDQHDYVCKVDASGGLVVATLPDPSTVEGMVVHIKKIDDSANYVRIDAAANGGTIDGEDTFDLILQGESLMLHCDSVSWAVL